MNKLFKIDRERKSVLVRFDPRTKENEADTLLLILFALRREFGVTRVGLSSADSALKATFPVVFPFLEIAKKISGEDLHAPNRATEIAQTYLQGEVDVVGLSSGGRLQINRSGYFRAAVLARDLISRAD